MPNTLTRASSTSKAALLSGGALHFWKISANVFRGSDGKYYRANQVIAIQLGQKLDKAAGKN
jgi:hypothetical protein